MPKIHQNVQNVHSLSYIIWIWKLFNSFDRSCEKLKSMWVHGMVFRISPLENWGQNVKITTGLALCQNNDDWKPPMKHNMYVSFDRSTTYSATIEHWSCISYGGLCGVFFFILITHRLILFRMPPLFAILSKNLNENSTWQYSALPI